MRRGWGAGTARLAAAVLALAAVVLPGTPARAEACAGVTAVVDFGALGGGVQQRCVADGAGQTAWKVFTDAGFQLKAVTNFRGAVCRVDGEPAADPCVEMPPANAYWGLFWSTGSGWVYSTKGADSLTVPAGGSVGFAWQNSTAPRAPGAAASSPRPRPKPTKTASPRPTARPTTTSSPAAAAKPRATSPSATRSPSASATPSARASASSSATPTAAATTAVPSPSAAPSSAEAAGPVASRNAADRTSGLPWWVPVGVLVLLAGGGAGAAWRRRRSTG